MVDVEKELQPKNIVMSPIMATLNVILGVGLGVLFLLIGSMVAQFHPLLKHFVFIFGIIFLLAGILFFTKRKNSIMNGRLSTIFIIAGALDFLIGVLVFIKS